MFLLFLLVIAIPISFAEDNLTSQAIDDGSLQVSIEDSTNISTSNDNEILRANDVYFDASASSDGSGTQNSPYKTLSSSKLGTINHFAPGTYRVSSSISTMFSTSAMTFMGTDRDSTIIEYTGGDTFLSSGSDLTFSGITLKGCTIVSTGGLLTATNVIFDSGKAVVEEEADHSYYDNSYGGAIKKAASSSSIDWSSIFGGSSESGLKIDDCIFRNNFAAYGGAIYVEGGETTITNTRFESNHATNYGGSVAALNKAKLTISDCEFDGDYSSYDAGGSIYVFNATQAIVKNSNFNNCLATFGPAIASLNSTTTVTNSNFNRNKASWQGGAIYAIYGSLTVTSSNFNENSAKNGGAIFADNLTSFEVNGGKFEGNVANDTAGAIFAFANIANKISTAYSSNSAKNHNDLYQTKTIDLVIGSSDYEMMQYKSSYNGALPSKFDLRSIGAVTPVKNQGQSGNCWAFATIATLESAILKATGKQYILSEGNLKDLAQRFSDIGWDYETNNGGQYQMALGYLTSWAGPVNISMDPTDDWDVLAPILNSVMHVQNVLFLQRTGFTDNNAIKQAIMDYGAVSSEIYWNNNYVKGTSGYYYDGSEGRNHAISVVGWDDTKSISGAPGTGAWIIKNSYGTTHGEGGYYYVSYYDKSLFRLNDATYNSYAIILNDTVRYNKNYQYDAGFTDYFITGDDTLWYKNTFTSTGRDILSAFSTYFNRVTNWEAKIYLNDELKLTQSGKSNAGYYTIPLSEQIQLAIGDKFTIELKINCRGNAQIPISESVVITKDYGKPGISFFSKDGSTWTDFYNYKSTYGSGETGHNYFSQVACLKAFTVEGSGNDSVLKDLTLKINNGNIVYGEDLILDVSLTDAFGQKVDLPVVIEINGKSYSNGDKVAKLAPGTYTISAKVSQTGEYNAKSISKAITVSKLPSRLQLEINDINAGDKLNINAILSGVDDDTVTVNVNGQNYVIEIKKGEGSITIENNLKPGSYSAIGEYAGNDIYESSKDTCSFNVNSKTKANPSLIVSANDITEGQNAVIVVIVPSDIKSDIKLTINSNSYTSRASNGQATFDIGGLSAGRHDFTVSFDGDDNYNSVSIQDSVKVLSKEKEDPMLILSCFDAVRGEDVKVDVILQGDIKSDLTLILNDETYTAKSSNGKASFTIKGLSVGKYEYTVNFNGDESYKASQVVGSFKVLSTIVSEDMKRAYLSGNDFEARLYDMNSNALKNTYIDVTVDGKSYSIKTDNVGVLKLNLKLKVGNHVIGITNPVTGEKSSNEVKIVKRIVNNKDLIMDYSVASAYKVRIIGDDGKAIGAGKQVIFKFNKKTYKAKTNSKGYASLKITAVPGKYKITAQYGGVKVENKITVKSVIKSKNISKKKSKTTKFSITLKTSKGKVLSNKKVTFKFKGKKYSAKTNKKGVATLSLKNLKVGKYSIKTTYIKASVSNTIKIKK